VPGPAEARRWLAYAQQDLAAANVLLSHVDVPRRIACFHAQQGVEKALKASLVGSDIEFLKTHDVVVLVERSLSRFARQWKASIWLGSSSGRLTPVIRLTFPMSAQPKRATSSSWHARSSTS
jgi:hypothetical protein